MSGIISAEQLENISQTAQKILEEFFQALASKTAAENSENLKKNLFDYLSLLQDFQNKLIIATQGKTPEFEALSAQFPLFTYPQDVLKQSSLPARKKFLAKLPENLQAKPAIKNLNFYAELLDLLKSTQGQVSFMGGEKVEGLGNGKFPHHAAMLLKAIQRGEFANDPEKLCSKYAVIFKELKRRPKLLGKRDPKVAEAYENIVDLINSFTTNIEFSRGVKPGLFTSTEQEAIAKKLTRVKPSKEPESYFDQYLEKPRDAQLFSETGTEAINYEKIQTSQESEDYFKKTYLS